LNYGKDAGDQQPKQKPALEEKKEEPKDHALAISIFISVPDKHE
jgi:hypothetical protein